jgi:hypothetical protein
MKFATHTPMTSASYADLQLASIQGSIVQVAMANSGRVVGQGGYKAKSSTATSGADIWFFVSSFVVLVAGFFYKKSTGKKSDMLEPMILTDYVAA